MGKAKRPVAPQPVVPQPEEEKEDENPELAASWPFLGSGKGKISNHLITSNFQIVALFRCPSLQRVLPHLH